MKEKFFGALVVTGVVSLGMVAFAQQTEKPAQPATQAPAQPQAQPAQPPTQKPAAPPATTQREAVDQKVMITGCVQREADYRKAQDAGKGGAAGTGVGTGNEFVLINAQMAGGAAGTAGATGTAGAAGRAYELTGSNEGQLAQHVGKRVEITGMIKAGEVGTAGKPTGGPTGGAPLSQDLKLQELEVNSVKEVAGNCPA